MENKNQIESKKSDNIFYYVGDPYYIEGVKYTPEENYNYTEVGLSTFYGKELHNVRTVNNDFNKVTELYGRHKTLPIPSMVKVTNLDNGFSINIKIIDRHDDNAALIHSISNTSNSGVEVGWIEENSLNSNNSRHRNKSRCWKKFLRHF